MTTLPAAQRKLLAALLGLAGERRIVRGIGTKALASVAGLDHARDVSPTAEALARYGLIFFTPGTFRQTHSYGLRITVRARLQLQLATQSRNRLREALRKRTPAQPAAAA
jgi:hypothetical protein